MREPGGFPCHSRIPEGIACQVFSALRKGTPLFSSVTASVGGALRDCFCEF